MDPLDFLEPEKLLHFLHVQKTELSCLENPHTFITQLRDHDLIPEDRYKDMSRMKSKDRLRKALYDVLDWLERERSQHIKLFWSSVFRETIMNHYPVLRMLRNSLMDGSFHFTQLPERVDKEDTGRGKRKELSEDEEEEEEEKKTNSVKKKRKPRRKRVREEEEEQACPSSPVRNINFSSPLKKGERGDIWTWAIYKSQLPVTCGHQKGFLNRRRLAEGEKCIVVDKQWFTPNEFERLAGRESFKNWKVSIRCEGTTLGKLIQEGHLTSVRYKKAKKTLLPSAHSITVSDTEEDDGEDENEDNEDRTSSDSRGSSSDVTDEEEQTEWQSEARHDSGRKVFRVTCGALTGTLHKHRFASGTCGKSIRTETSWMTPVEFMNLALGQTDRPWRKEIELEGQPLGVLTEAKMLTIHQLHCDCPLCRPDDEDMRNQKNDDVCCTCKNEKNEEDVLVMCEGCPRSFHPKCHLPHVEAAIMGDSNLWMCTFCVFRSNQGCYYRDELKREAAMSRKISQHMLECQYLLLHLCSADEEQTFADDPTLYLSDYSAVVKTPMWLGSVAAKLQKQLYQTVGEFVSDVQLIFTNCASYNQGKAKFFDMGNRLKKLFDEEFKNVFNIHE
ncbi:nuclear body protein SP140-like protein [Acanthopagrus latus]|uniref:nuclear body protein SP140-like protein n=1 Tax=Acanthopagrus latus TaxID=8177 RepID=UPI00187CA396|nr:nuclear body protein SP140-like protein [Acanthopagrus latus]